MKIINAILVSLYTSSSVFALDLTTSGNIRRRAAQIGAYNNNVEEERSETTSLNALEPQEGDMMVKVRITNQAYQQPFGAFFVMTHNKDETPLFTIGAEASPALARLAEDGNPDPLVEAYNASSHINYLNVVSDGAPYRGGETLEFMVPYNAEYPYLTIASMAINTNDCFVALNGVKLEQERVVLQVPGYDSGTEENNELCASIPGPACASVEGNIASLNGEGFVHVHRGFFGVGDLPAPGYDWRNPMMRVEMEPKL